MNDRLKEVLERSQDNILVDTEEGRIAKDRSVGVVLFVYWRSKVHGKIIFVICRRGTRTSEEKRKWNLPSGYLGWNESGEEAAARECWEECGIETDPREVEELEHSTSPKENRQNIIFRYGIELPGPPEFAADGQEILEVKFITEEELDDLDFAWTQKETIKRLIKRVS